MAARGSPGARLTPCVFLLLLLAGCGEGGPHGAFDTYLSRLERPLETTAPAWEPGTTPRPPRAAKLRLPLSPGRLDALDFLALRGCELQVTVGKRNSSLGRLAPPSQALLLELEFLRLAPSCIDHLLSEGKESLAEELNQAMADKRGDLPARIYNATLASDEFRSLWRAPQTLGDYPAATSSAPVSALGAIDRQAEEWLAGNYAASNRDFEILLGEVARGDAGTLLAALKLQESGLQAANTMLRSHLDQGGFCEGSLRRQGLDVFKNVVDRFFIGGIQPWSASVSQRQHGLIPPIRQLEARLDGVLPPAYREWQALRDAALDSGAAAPRRHVEQVQESLSKCSGQSPDRPLQAGVSER